MAQVKIYGFHDQLNRYRSEISEGIHASAMAAFGLPAEKRFHRFCGMDAADFIFPGDRSRQYTIIEVSMFEGRSVEAKKAFLRQVFTELATRCNISPQDVEITIFETPMHNWGIRGVPGDELVLGYTVEV